MRKFFKGSQTAWRNFSNLAVIIAAPFLGMGLDN